jgi:hypothetical protein
MGQFVEKRSSAASERRRSRSGADVGTSVIRSGDETVIASMLAVCAQGTVAVASVELFAAPRRLEAE